MKNFTETKKNNKTMKNVFKISLMLAVMLTFLNSCSDDLLEKAPLNELSAEGFYNTQADAEAAIGGIYGKMTETFSGYYKWTHSVWSDMRADNTHAGFVADFMNAQLHVSRASSNEPHPYAWNENFKFIGEANSVLDNVPGIEDPNFSDSARNSILGQAYFIRGFCYFNLARVFGGVPIQLSNNDPEIFKAKSSQAEVYAQVIEDMLMAESLLPQEYSSNFETRARGTKGGAQSILAKVYAEIRDYNKCAEYAGKVINSGVYELLPTFDHLFDDQHKYNRESIFETVHVANNSNIATYASVQMTPPGDWSQYDDPTKTGSSWTVSYHRFNTASTDLMAAFEEMGDDVRKYSSTITVSDRSLISDPAYGYGSNEPISHMYKMGRSGEIFGGSNVMLLRLADIILLRAEALNAIGQTADAITLLDQVRARVNLAPTAATSQSEVKLAILKERRLELLVENNRYWDLQRYFNDTSLFVAYLNGLTDSSGNSLGYQATADKIFAPIPQSEVDINPNLVQNAGY
jgi:hypothetical protein